MATYRSAPGRFRNGVDRASEKVMLGAEESKRRRKIHVIQDPWRRDHPRKLKGQQPADQADQVNSNA